MRRLNNGVGTFVISGSPSDMERLPEACHRSFRTKAMPPAYRAAANKSGIRNSVQVRTHRLGLAPYP